MNTAMTSRKRRRRTCYDRFRKRMLEFRRTLGLNPAGSVALQLLGVFTFIVGRIPAATPMPTPYIAPPMSPRHTQRIETARRLGIPVRYLDIVLSQGEVPYSILFDHIRQGGPMRRDAMNELRKRAPDAALAWLSHIERKGLWSDLTRCFHRNGSEEDTDVSLLKATLAWVEAQQKPIPSASGLSEIVVALMPVADVGNEELENDPNKPKL